MNSNWNGSGDAPEGREGVPRAVPRDKSPAGAGSYLPRGLQPANMLCGNHFEIFRV